MRKNCLLVILNIFDSENWLFLFIVINDFLNFRNDLFTNYSALGKSLEVVYYISEQKTALNRLFFFLQEKNKKKISKIKKDFFYLIFKN